MNWHKRFTAILILLLLASTFFVALHHHDNAVDDHNCPICFVCQHHQGVSQSASAFDSALCFVPIIYVAPRPIIIDAIVVSLQNNRAPPA